MVRQQDLVRAVRQFVLIIEHGGVGIAGWAIPVDSREGPRLVESNLGRLLWRGQVQISFLPLLPSRGYSSTTMPEPLSECARLESLPANDPPWQSGKLTPWTLSCG